jgi:hypothetical protein
VPAEGGRDEDERPRPVRVLEGELERDLAAEGVADEGRGLDPQVVEEGCEVVDVGKRTARKRRLAVAAEVVADDEMAVGERGDLPVPEPPVAYRGVEEDDGRPFSARVVGDVRAVDVRRAQLDCDWASRRRPASVFSSAQATFGFSSTKGRNSQGVSP